MREAGAEVFGVVQDTKRRVEMTSREMGPQMHINYKHAGAPLHTLALIVPGCAELWHSSGCALSSSLLQRLELATSQEWGHGHSFLLKYSRL